VGGRGVAAEIGGKGKIFGSLLASGVRRKGKIFGSLIETDLC